MCTSTRVPLHELSRYAHTVAGGSGQVALGKLPFMGVYRAVAKGVEDLIMAINGYTVTSGILVGITDGSALTTIPLETDIKLHLGYVTADNRELSVMGERFVSHLARSLDLYANR